MVLRDVDRAGRPGTRAKSDEMLWDYRLDYLEFRCFLLIFQLVSLNRSVMQQMINESSFCKEDGSF